MLCEQASAFKLISGCDIERVRYDARSRCTWCTHHLRRPPCIRERGRSAKICENKSETSASAVADQVDSIMAALTFTLTAMEAMEAMEVDGAGRANIAIALLECGVVTSCDADATDVRARIRAR